MRCNSLCYSIFVHAMLPMLQVTGGGKLVREHDYLTGHTRYRLTSYPSLPPKASLASASLIPFFSTISSTPLTSAAGGPDLRYDRLSSMLAGITGRRLTTAPLWQKGLPQLLQQTRPGDYGSILSIQAFLLWVLGKPNQH
jgi:hypothetical protein